MNTAAGWQIEDRGRRHVRHARLCVPEGAPRHRLASTIEEALRLANLPGENEGRTYYFRRLRLTGLPVDGNRRVWHDAFQHALTQEAAAAIHGADPRAGQSLAVFFRGRQEALEILLHRIVERRVAAEWFWPMVIDETEPASGNSPASTQLSGAAVIPAIVEALRATPASWLAVAAAVFAVPGGDVVYLLRSIPVAMAQAWLEEMDDGQAVSTRVEPRISARAQRAVQPGVQVFGSEDVRAVWLTALAILHESPAEMAGGTVVQRARMALRALPSGGGAPGGSVIPPQGKLLRPPEGGSHAPDPVEALSSQHAARDAVSPAPEPPPGSTAPPESLLVSGPASAAPAVSGDTLQSTPFRWDVDGVATRAAGLFFLLNALQRIGIAPAFASGLASAYPDFLALLFERLAAHAGAAADDPIVVWIASLASDVANASDRPCDLAWWPSNLSPSRDTASLEFLLRVWVLGVRRWCWRTGRITLREIVTRPGVFSVNRTDLDVSLPLEEVAIRIRRIGLDLDPGWLPWFGRVVRFHYLDRREFHG